MKPLYWRQYSYFFPHYSCHFYWFFFFFQIILLMNDSMPFTVYVCRVCRLSLTLTEALMAQPQRLLSMPGKHFWSICLVSSFIVTNGTPSCIVTVHPAPVQYPRFNSLSTKCIIEPFLLIFKMQRDKRWHWSVHVASACTVYCQYQIQYKHPFIPLYGSSWWNISQWQDPGMERETWAQVQRGTDVSQSKQSQHLTHTHTHKTHSWSHL